MPALPPFSAGASGSRAPKPAATPASAPGASESGAAASATKAAKEAPVTVGGKPIEVRWRTARAYSYQADEHPAGHSLLDHPQGMKSYHGIERRPKRIESVAREMGGDHADGPGDGVLRRKDELKHYLSEFGATAVQARLTYLPVQSRRPSDEELHVMQDFAKSVHQYSRLSQGKRGPRHGEFIATYARVTDKDTGASTLERTNFRYNAAHSIDVPDKGAPHDYVIHSHPYDPKHPMSAGVTDPLGGAYPSGQDRLMARMIGKGGQAPAREMLMHGGQVYHTHGDDLHFSLLDPAAGETLHLADRAQGVGWDDGLYFSPANRPSTPVSQIRPDSPESPEVSAPGAAGYGKTKPVDDDAASTTAIYEGH